MSVTQLMIFRSNKIFSKLFSHNTNREAIQNEFRVYRHRIDEIRMDISLIPVKTPPF